MFEQHVGHGARGSLLHSRASLGGTQFPLKFVHPGFCYTAFEGFFCLFHLLFWPNTARGMLFPNQGLKLEQ